MQIQRYIAKISGPLLDRIDIHLEVPALRAREIFADSHQETSQEIKKRTSGAREIQLQRFRDFAQASCGVYTNAQMNSAQIKKFCCLSKEGVDFWREVRPSSLTTQLRRYNIGVWIGSFLGKTDISKRKISIKIKVV